MDRLAAMESFARVASAGSFSRAARGLRLSKSVVSRQIAALEAELGAQLFQRSTRALALTEAGRLYLERVTRILDEIEEADRSVGQLQGAPRGLLRVNAPMSFGFLHLAPAMPDFFARHPDVSIDLSMTDRYVDLVDEGYDIAVRIGALADSSLIVRRLAPCRMAVCASPAYLARRGVPRTPDDLTEHDCLNNTNASAGSEWRFAQADGTVRLVRVSGRLMASNGDALQAAAREGLGLIYLPTFIVGEDLQKGRLQSVLDGYTVADSMVNAVYPHARHLSPKVRAFVDFLAGRFGPTPPWDLPSRQAARPRQVRTDPARSSFGAAT